MKSKILIVLIFIIITLPMLAKPKTVVEKKKVTNATEIKEVTIGSNYGDLLKIKGKPLDEERESLNKKEVTSLFYREKWFEMADEYKTEYKIADNEIFQIRILFPQGIDKIDLIGKITKVLGTSQQGKFGIFSPVKYYSSWMKNGVNFVLQDYGAYIEMFIARAYFYDSDNKYDINEESVIIKRVKANLTDLESENELYLLGVLKEKSNTEFNEMVMVMTGKSEVEKGKKIVLPKNLSGETFDISVIDLDNDEIKEIFVVIGKDGENSEKYFGIYSLKNEAAKSIADADILGVKKVSGVYENGYAVKVKSEISGREYWFDIKDKKKSYAKEKIYVNEKLGKPVKISGTAITECSMTDTDNDNIPEIKIVQTIKGINSQDNIVSLADYYKYSNGEFKFLKEEVEKAD